MKRIRGSPLLDTKERRFVRGVSADLKVAAIGNMHVGTYPFRAQILSRFSLRIDDRVSTMAVSMGGRRGINLTCNASFVDGLHIDEVCGVLLHEVHHVLLGHVYADRSRYPDVIETGGWDDPGHRRIDTRLHRAARGETHRIEN